MTEARRRESANHLVRPWTCCGRNRSFGFPSRFRESITIGETPRECRGNYTTAENSAHARPRVILRNYVPRPETASPSLEIIRQNAAEPRNDDAPEPDCQFRPISTSRHAPRPVTSVVVHTDQYLPDVIATGSPPPNGTRSRMSSTRVHSAI